MFELFRIYLPEIPKEMSNQILSFHISQSKIILLFRTDKEISDPIINESLYYSWTWDHFKITDSETVVNLSRNNLLYSIVRHPFER